jgi:nucleotide-binding universal stress UspA family protein
MLLDRILVPLDGSELSEVALAQLGRLLRRKDAEVLLLQVVHIPAQPGLELAPLLATMKDEAQSFISNLVRHLAREGARARGFVRVGSEAETILEVAREEKATLIAMSTHGRTGLSRFVFGSVTERVLRCSPIPVLVVRSYEAVAAGAARVPSQEVPVRTLLAPVDGSEASLSSVGPAIEVARSFGARALVLGVVKPSPHGAREGEPLIRAAVSQFGAAGIPVDPVVRIGDPASEILDAASRHEADLVVMATHGRSGPGRWVFGSVTEKVLRASTTPMLIVPMAK